MAILRPGAAALLALFVAMPSCLALASECSGAACDNDDVTLLQMTRGDVVKQVGVVVGAHVNDADGVVCPPPNFASVSAFDLDTFISARWHVQQMMHDAAEPPQEFQCQSAEYFVREEETVPGSTAWELEGRVHVDMPNGTMPNGISRWQNVDHVHCLLAVDASAGKFAKGQCNSSLQTSSPFWVIAYNEDEGYAAASGGPPTETFLGGCRNPVGFSNSGLWIFTRQQTRDDALVQSVRSQLQDMGFDLSVLHDVTQTFCPSAPVVPASAGSIFHDTTGFVGEWHDDHGGIVTITKESSTQLMMTDTWADDGTYYCTIANATHCEMILHGTPIFAELQASGHHIHWHMDAGHEEWQRVGFEEEDDAWQHGPEPSPALAAEIADSANVAVASGGEELEEEVTAEQAASNADSANVKVAAGGEELEEEVTTEQAASTGDSANDAVTLLKFGQPRPHL